MSEIGRVMAMIGALIQSGGPHKIAMGEATLQHGEPALIVVATGSGSALLRQAIERATPRAFRDVRIPDHASN